jgi:hypothetical protein
MEEDCFMCRHLSDYCRLLKVSVELGRAHSDPTLFLESDNC